MDDFTFSIDESAFEFDASDVAIGRTRPSETIRTWNESELKSIATGTGNGDSESASIVAICEGRGILSEIGFAVFDTQSSQCHIIQVINRKERKDHLHLNYQNSFISTLIHQIIQELCIC